MLKCIDWNIDHMIYNRRLSAVRRVKTKRKAWYIRKNEIRGKRQSSTEDWENTKNPVVRKREEETETANLKVVVRVEINWEEKSGEIRCYVYVRRHVLQ